MQVGLFTPDRSFIISNLDAQTIDLERFQYTQANITMFRIIDRDFLIDEFKSIDARLDEEHEKCKDPTFCSQEEYDGMKYFDQYSNAN